MTAPPGIGLVTWTTKSTVPEAPAFSVPRFQVTTPPASDPPAVAETNAVFTGIVSVITVLVAFSLPVFE